MEQILEKEKNIKSVYIHIPFCHTICSYCDFPKLLYRKKWIPLYLHALQQEINTRYQGEAVDTLYIGGGTPSALSNQELKQLFQYLSVIQKKEHCECTIECNVDSMNKEKLDIMKENGINRISIGIETFHHTHLKQINRNLDKNKLISLVAYAREIGISNINFDLMYALPNETILDLEQDLEQLLELKPTHISTYSLMIEPHTVFGVTNIEPIDEDIDAFMYETICTTLKQVGYEHYEISNFSLPGYQSRHNKTYWNNEPYYGFGLGASGYYDGVRYSNTKNINSYLNGTYEQEHDILSIRETMEYEMILGLRKQEGVSKKIFAQKYGCQMEDVFPIDQLLKEGRIVQTHDRVQIPSNYWYISNDILLQFIGGTYESNSK